MDSGGWIDRGHDQEKAIVRNQKRTYSERKAKSSIERKSKSSKENGDTIRSKLPAQTLIECANLMIFICVDSVWQEGKKIFFSRVGCVEPITRWKGYLRIHEQGGGIRL